MTVRAVISDDGYLHSNEFDAGPYFASTPELSVMRVRDIVADGCGGYAGDALAAELRDTVPAVEQVLAYCEQQMASTRAIGSDVYPGYEVTVCASDLDDFVAFALPRLHPEVAERLHEIATMQASTGLF